MSKTITISIECDSDAMQNTDGICYVLTEAQKAIRRDDVELDYHYPLHDINGNKVGYIEATDTDED